jgi:hypothetical protein
MRNLIVMVTIIIIIIIVIIIYHYHNCILHQILRLIKSRRMEVAGACSTHGYVEVDWTHLAQERGHSECDLKAHSGILASDLNNTPCSKILKTLLKYDE